MRFRFSRRASRAATGFCCLYRPREGEAPYGEPDAAATCPDTDVVAATHADQLWDAGVDFVYVDLTNLPAYSAFSDVLGVRPFEGLLEEWAALRAAGRPTPQAAAWVPAAARSEGQEPTWEQLIPLYQDPAYADLVLRHVPTGEPVIFIVNHSLDAAEVERVRAEGLLPVPLWGNLDVGALAAGGPAGCSPAPRAGPSPPSWRQTPPVTRAGAPPPPSARWSASAPATRSATPACRSRPRAAPGG